MSDRLKIVLIMTVWVNSFGTQKDMNETPQKTSLLLRKGCERFTPYLHPPPHVVHRVHFMLNLFFFRVDYGTYTEWGCVTVVNHAISENFGILSFKITWLPV